MARPVSDPRSPPAAPHLGGCALPPPTASEPLDVVLGSLREAVRDMGYGVRYLQLRIREAKVEPEVPLTGPYREALRILEAEIARVDARMRQLVGGKP